MRFRPTRPHADTFDVLVVGAGHAGCEAALAAARIGRRTALVSTNLGTTAQMPCNPSIGGPAKGNLVREIDALGGEMARNTDRTQIQIRELNTSKGPAVRALRAQCDKHAYGRLMRRVLETQTNLTLLEAHVEGLIWDSEPSDGAPAWRVRGVRTNHGQEICAHATVVTTGTFLQGRIILGDTDSPGGRRGEPPVPTWSMNAEELHQLFDVMDKIFLPNPVSRYISRLTASTHPNFPESTDDVRKYVTYAASPRAAIAMAEAARASALISGRPTVGFEDVKSVAPSVLNHRVILNYQARFDSVDTFAVVSSLLDSLDETNLNLPDDVEIRLESERVWIENHPN